MLPENLNISNVHFFSFFLFFKNTTLVRDKSESVNSITVSQCRLGVMVRDVRGVTT